MPEYLYRCAECKKSFSTVMSMTEYGTKKVRCPKCGSKKVERRISAFSAVTSKKS